MDINDELVSPMPDIPPELIKMVTGVETIYRGLRTEGLYRKESAELILKTHVRFHPSESFMDMGTGRESWQDITVSGSSVEAVKEIYSLVRQGKLEPEQDWESPPAVQEVTPVEEGANPE